MQNRFKIVTAYLFAIPLALILGFLSASPDELTLMLVGLLFFFLTLPLLIRWHHVLLIVFWNSVFCFTFLPGQLPFWLLFTALSFGISFLNYVVGRRPFINVPELTGPMLFLSAVVLFTAFYRGGLGLKVFGGGSQGGKFYIYVLGAVLGYFALVAMPIQKSQGKTLGALFFLSGTTAALSNIAYTLGPAAYFVFFLVPSGVAQTQAAAELRGAAMDRLEGLGQFASFGLSFLFVLYGLRGGLRLNRPWRLFIFAVPFIACLFSGFRSAFIFLILVSCFQFYFEGMLRLRNILIGILMGIFAFGVVLLASRHMPLSVQRTISFLPVDVDAAAREDAAGSTDWRIEMWQIVWKDVPKYLLVGKGYSIDPTEMFLTREAIHSGLIDTFEEALLSGDYHSGPLSILVPFGIAGVVGFVWLLVAGFRVLYGNYRFGDPKLRPTNTAILSFYCAKAIGYFLLFGSFNSELYIYLGVMGLSVSLNNGYHKTPMVSAKEILRAPKSRAFAVEV